MTVLVSSEDRSVNFVDYTPDGGAIESRYVRRSDDYFICYVSSHTGCSRACRFCHLTATGQTMMQDVTMDGYLLQARKVLDYYGQVAAEQGIAERVNFNFMARGEPLDNPNVLKYWRHIETALSTQAELNNLRSKFNISSIIPKGMIDVRNVLSQFKDRTSIYYSLYSMRPEFRRRWLPKAMEPNAALDLLAQWQQDTGQLLTLHWAFIEGENDDLGTLEEILEAIQSRDIRAKFNLVRYNPYSERQGQEPEYAVLTRNFAFMNSSLGHPDSKIVPRVGFDVKASCGMFVEPNEI